MAISSYHNFLSQKLTDDNSIISGNDRKRVKYFWSIGNGNKEACHITLHDFKKSQIQIREIFINTKQDFLI